MNKLFIKIWIFLCAISGMAQEQLITGLISDEMGPIPGANIISMNGQQGTVSDIDGKFELQADPNDILKISFVGFVNQDININGREYIEVVLIEDQNMLDELVLIGMEV